MLKSIIIGQAPHNSAVKNFRPLIDGKCGYKLAEICGIKHEEYARIFDTINLIDEYRGKSGKGDIFPLKEARKKVIEIWPDLNYDIIILAGKAVASSFRIKIDYFQWTQIENKNITVIPHPSGINRWWNDDFNKEKAKKFMRNLIKEMKYDKRRIKSY